MFLLVFRYIYSKQGSSETLQYLTIGVRNHMLSSFIIAVLSAAGAVKITLENLTSFRRFGKRVSRRLETKK